MYECIYVYRYQCNVYRRVPVYLYANVRVDVCVTWSGKFLVFLNFKLKFNKANRINLNRTDGTNDIYDNINKCILQQ